MGVDYLDAPVFFGGLNSVGTVMMSYYQYGGSGWTYYPNFTDAPGARYGASMALLAPSLVMFGGSITVDYLSDTWVWDGSAWTELSPAISPSARAFQAMAAF